MTPSQISKALRALRLDPEYYRASEQVLNSLADSIDALPEVADEGLRVLLEKIKAANDTSEVLNPSATMIMTHALASEALSSTPQTGERKVTKHVQIRNHNGGWFTSEALNEHELAEALKNLPAEETRIIQRTILEQEITSSTDSACSPAESSTEVSKPASQSEP
jgi:hypothetical protein